MAADPSIPVWRAFPPTPRPPPSEACARVVIVGGGPVGLTAALDLGRRGHPVVVLNRLACVTAGSKAICFSKRTLDTWDRLGVGEAMVERGVVWNVGKVFRGAAPDPIYAFDMLPLKQQKMPGFINLQQYHVEALLLEALSALPHVEVRWAHEVVVVDPGADAVRLRVETAEGLYELTTEWLLACDGSRSPVRTALGLDFDGRVFEDNFLIADVRVKQERPVERWFWFDPPFNPGRSSLLHKQPDDVWRLDFQLGWDIDREACVRPQNVEPLVRGMLGPDVAFTREWYSVYTFQCRRMSKFVHGRVIFAGDSAHLVSPFGARGCNGGVADADNLAWKLDLVLRGRATASLLESYDAEAVAAADENILASSRSTDFMTPKTPAHRALRDAVLDLAEHHAFARPFVNSGRLSTPACYPAGGLETADTPGDDWTGPRPGAPAVDAVTGRGWLFEALGEGFTLLTAGWAGALPPGVARLDVEGAGDPSGLIRERYDLAPSAAYLLRPDRYVAARWKRPTETAVDRAYARAAGLD